MISILNQTLDLLPVLANCGLGAQVVRSPELPGYDDLQGLSHPRSVFGLKFLSELLAIDQWLQLICFE